MVMFQGTLIGLGVILMIQSMFSPLSMLSFWMFISLLCISVIM